MLLLIYMTFTRAEVVFDGTLGPAVSLEGPNFDIKADFGQQYGGNLFHSFKWFNLNQGDTATFSGPNTVENIISRVTGGKSFVDGLLHSKIPQADLYLINPDGFIFGSNAKLDLQGSFHLSTASQLYLGDSGLFDTRHPKRSVLVSAPPSAFGFLDKSAPIEIKGSQLATPDSQTLSILGGSLNIDAGRFRATSGRINLAAIAWSNQLKSIPNGLQVEANTQFGSITLKNQTLIDTGKLSAGDIYIRGGQFFLENSSITANTIEQDSGVIAIDVNELHLNQANIESRALAFGQGGQIRIKVAGNATLSNQSKIQTSSISTDPKAGDVGNIVLKAQYLDLLGSTISTTTSGPGQGGDITIEAIEGINLIGSADFPSAIQASSEPKKGDVSAGDAGRINIRAKNLNLVGQNSKIDNSTGGRGQGGSITLVISERLHLSHDALISADSLGLGKAGSIFINATSLEMDNGTISTASEQAEGGNIILNVPSHLDMNNSLLSATVRGGKGNGGNLLIGNPRFVCLQDSLIDANASAGNGGLVLILTGTSIKLIDSSITASSETGLEGEVKIDDIYNVDIGTLPGDFLEDASLLIKKRCAAQTDTQSSSFFILGRGGLPNAPDDLQTYIPVSGEILQLSPNSKEEEM